LAEGMT